MMSILIQAAKIATMDTTLGSYIQRIREVRLRSQALGMPDAIKRRGQLMKQKTTLIEQIRRAEQLVTTGRRDLDWFDAFDREAQTKLEALDTELAELLVIPTEDDYAIRLASLDRLMPALPAGSIPTELLRSLVSALGHVVFDGTVRIDYREDGIEVGGDAVVCVRGELLA